MLVSAWYVNIFSSLPCHSEIPERQYIDYSDDSLTSLREDEREARDYMRVIAVVCGIFSLHGDGSL